ncbi:hypothetical protein BH11PSE14_BH11PSE14_12270 [soil metagenome]
MHRLLLIICLALFASAAIAGTPAVADDTADAAVKSGKSPAPTAAPDADPAQSHPAVAPARAATPHLPRWHSLLPGMIR